MSNARDVILEAAFRAFMMHGYDGTGVVAILDGTGLSKGAFYHHFDSKAALFAEVVATYFPTPFADMDWSAHAALGAEAQKLAIAAIYEKVAADSAATGADLTRYFTLFFDALSRLPDYRADIDNAYARLQSSLAAALMRDTGMDRASARGAARAYIAGFEGEFYLWAISGTRPDALSRR